MTDSSIPRAEITAAATFIRAHTRYSPTIGIVLGSGLSEVTDTIENAERISYADIPHFPVPSVLGHIGELVLGELGGKQVAALRGRVHYYEGYTMQTVTFPIRVLRELGAATVIVTNAAGGLNTSFRAGDLMLITDQINLAGMAGLNPLRGPNDDSLGPRFPDMTNAYDRDYRALAKQAARDLGIILREGVYVMLAGPNFETPADSRFLRQIGADAVGMSTAPEVIVARHGGQRVLGVSLISNEIPAGEAHAEANHEEVLAAGRAAAPRMAALIRELVSRIE
jgi:purine-nucleoside phosphorylase